MSLRRYNSGIVVCHEHVLSLPLSLSLSLHSDAFLIVVAVILISLLHVLMVATFVGYYAHSTMNSIASVVSSGSVLIYTCQANFELPCILMVYCHGILF